LVQSATSVDFGSLVNVGSAISGIVSGAGGCTGDPQRCGPPTVGFFGQAVDATANAIVSAAGDLLAVDLVSAGSAFGINNPPEVMIQDACRKGKGGSAFAEFAPAGGGGAGGGGAGGGGGGQQVLTAIVVETPGDGYLPRPDGSKGGDGREWARKDQTVVKRENRDFEPPFSPGEPIRLRAGDEITIPDNSIVDFPIQLIGGVTTVIEEEVVQQFENNVIEIIAPTPIDAPADIPIKGNADTYGVFLTICNPKILRRGIGYSPEDKIVIFPNSNGAQLEPVFDSNGSLQSINVINPGNGFDEWPTIYIESTTGFNAKIVPNFCVNRVDEVKEIPEGVPIIRVVDCVGRLIPQK